MARCGGAVVSVVIGMVLEGEGAVEIKVAAVDLELVLS